MKQPVDPSNRNDFCLYLFRICFLEKNGAAGGVFTYRFKSFFLNSRY